MPLTAQISSKYTNSERRIDPDWTTEKLAEKLEQITGIAPQYQTLHVTLANGQVLNANFLEGKLVKDCLPESIGTINIRVNDSRPESEQFSLDETVEKYEMSESDYEKRQNSVLQWKKQNHLGRFGGGVSGSSSAEQGDDVSHIAVGSRVTVTLKSGKKPEGTVQFIGKIREIPGDGTWVGVELVTADGKNDGSVGGVSYFNCEPLHGVFVKPSVVAAVSGVDSDDEV